MKNLMTLVLLAVFLSSSAQAQKGRLFVLSYKLSKGETLRVSTSTYRTFSAGRKQQKTSTYGETAFDMYQSVVRAEGGLYDIDATVELTRLTRDGQNLTYKLAGLFSKDRYYFTFDRFGRVMTDQTSHEIVRDSVQEMVRQNFPNFRSVFVPLPGQAVRVGEKWDAASVVDLQAWLEPFQSRLKMESPEIRGSYTLEDVSEGVAKITMAIDVAASGTLGESSVGLDFLMAITGEYYFDVNLGRMLNGSLVTRLESIAVTGSGEVEFSGSMTTTFSVESAR
jgi:hypothetical protein